MDNLIYQYSNVDVNGDLQKVTKEECQIAKPFGQKTAQNMIEHMNEDHVQAMVDYCKFAGLDCEKSRDTPTMTGIGIDGFLLSLGKQRIKFEFIAPCTTPLEARHALVNLAKKARHNPEATD